MRASRPFLEMSGEVTFPVILVTAQSVSAMPTLNAGWEVGADIGATD